MARNISLLGYLATLAMAMSAVAAPPGELDGTWMLDPVATEKLVLNTPPPPNAREIGEGLGIIGGYMCLFTYEFDGDRLTASGYSAHGRANSNEYRLVSEQGRERKYLRVGAAAAASDEYSVSGVGGKHLRIAHVDIAPMSNLLVWQRSSTSTEKTPIADVMAACKVWVLSAQNIIKYFNAAPPDADPNQRP
jgi:hypothetical protein